MPISLCRRDPVLHTRRFIQWRVTVHSLHRGSGLLLCMLLRVLLCTACTEGPGLSRVLVRIVCIQESHFRFGVGQLANNIRE